MINLYIDESGSLTKNPSKFNRFFFIGIVNVKNPTRIKRRFERFVSSNMEELQEINNKHIAKAKARGEAKPSTMFVNGKFKELKGNVLTKEMKFKFLDYICVDNEVEFYLIKFDNCYQQKNFLNNTARAFNYLLKLAFTKMAHDKTLEGSLHLHLDNRNVRTDSVRLLEEYLNTELVTAQNLYESIVAEYFSSENCKFVQIADVIANVHFSSYNSRDYKIKLKEIEEKGYIKLNFTFPLSSNAATQKSDELPI